MHTFALATAGIAFLAALLVFGALVVATYALGLARAARDLASHAARTDADLRSGLAVVRREMDQAETKIERIGRERRGRHRRPPTPTQGVTSELLATQGPANGRKIG
ncbi:MAG: hypothetical protein WDA27_00765 [Actinomycetota bacterium]